MYKKLSLLILLAMGFSSFVQAIPPRPAKCPSAERISSLGLSYSIKGPQGYTVAQIHSYDTNDTWLFGFTSIPASSSEDALSVGKEWLSSLYGTPQPMPVKEQNIWACIYHTGNGNLGVALTPLKMSGSIAHSLQLAIV